MSFDEQSGKMGLEPYRDTAKKARVRNGVAWWVDQAQSSTVVLRSLNVPGQAMLVGSMFPVFLAGLGPKCQGEDDNSSCSGAPRLMHVADSRKSGWAAVRSQKFWSPWASKFPAMRLVSIGILPGTPRCSSGSFLIGYLGSHPGREQPLASRFQMGTGKGRGH